MAREAVARFEVETDEAEAAEEGALREVEEGERHMQKATEPAEQAGQEESDSGSSVHGGDDDPFSNTDFDTLTRERVSAMQKALKEARPRTEAEIEQASAAKERVQQEGAAVRVVSGPVVARPPQGEGGHMLYSSGLWPSVPPPPQPRF